MLILAFPNPFLVALGCLVAGLALGVGHYIFIENLNRTQAYVWGVASLLTGFFMYCLFIGPATPVEVFIAFCAITGISGILVKVLYLLDATFGFKSSPDTTPDRENIARLETQNARLELENAKLKAETERLNGTPMAVFEYQRQEVVAALAAAIEIMSEVQTKTGVAYGHMASLQGVFANKGALNMSAKQLQALGQARNTQVHADTRAKVKPAQAGAADGGLSK